MCGSLGVAALAENSLGGLAVVLGVMYKLGLVVVITVTTVVLSIKVYITAIYADIWVSKATSQCGRVEWPRVSSPSPRQLTLSIVGTP